MDNSGLRGGFLSGPNGGLLDLETSFQRHQQTTFNHLGLTHQHHINVMGGLDDDDHRPIGLTELRGSTSNGFSMNIGKGRLIHPVDNDNMSEEDEPSFMDDGNGENSSGGKGKKGTPWQRMKWTDNVVRLLIAVVSCVDDDGNLESVEGPKRKSGILQKKGKWNTVSNIMMSKGCHVSPQQCEDKFNDLNKRYKRLNDILGRGTSCRVVENPSLMDTMTHLSAKAKDDVKKILSSKHLFYKEMCAYHNGQRIPNCQDLDLRGPSLRPGRCSNDLNGSDEEEAEGKDDSEDDESYNDGDGGNQDERTMVDEEDCHFWSQTGKQDSFHLEMAGIFDDPSKSSFEQREWIKKKMLQLQEQRVSLQAHSFELEQKHFKWLRYRAKKDRELERLRLEYERMRLENERRVLQLRQKEVDFSFRRPEATSDSLLLPLTD
ncbi:Myb_DNA-bind_4 domain-containing protein [Cephalotus follicularis]|uniref:Myb_DNA-bind_4 domain-containing protein n=1 Tax=Cephalotus follicularis TaxID=3775 RepID=A0A1Q3B613_CEPFO|nr:Myb_DNA-bind_4 domain-containing protein [Cephalotus follicularis]